MYYIRTILIEFLCVGQKKITDAAAGSINMMGGDAKLQWAREAPPASGSAVRCPSFERRQANRRQHLLQASFDLLTTASGHHRPPSDCQVKHKLWLFFFLELHQNPKNFLQKLQRRTSVGECVWMWEWQCGEGEGEKGVNMSWGLYY